MGPIGGTLLLGEEEEQVVRKLAVDGEKLLVVCLGFVVLIGAEVAVGEVVVVL